MAIVDIFHRFPVPSKVVGFSLLGLLILPVARFLQQGFQARSKIRRLQADGIPILPHSWLWGHLPLFFRYRRSYPDDVHWISVFQAWIMDNGAELFGGQVFPGGRQYPAIVYMDIWPLSTPFLVIMNHGLAGQVKALPVSNVLKHFMAPIEWNLSIGALEGEQWKLWRSRFNPGFSVRSILGLMPLMVEEIEVFGSLLRKKCRGKEGREWSSAFPIEEALINLTFDIIGRTVLDVQFGEQSETPSGFKDALLGQIALQGFGLEFISKLKKISPWWYAAVRRQDQRMNRILEPHIIKRADEMVAASSSSSSSIGNNGGVQTVVDLALKQWAVEQEERAKSGLGRETRPSREFIRVVESNVRLFVMAGYDSSASSLCFILGDLARNPGALAAMRAEHDAVFGPDPAAAAATLRKTPALINQIPYTLAVVRESMRLHPNIGAVRDGAPGTTMSVPGYEGVPWPTDGYSVWEGLVSMHREEAIWPRATEFLPERWLADSDIHKTTTPLPGEMLRTFAYRPRNCIGQDLILIELRVLLVMLGRTFDFTDGWDEWEAKTGISVTPVLGSKLYPAGDGVMHPSKGFPMRVRLAQR
ncbi:cytochrome P450 [Stachybotrys elegans]|uniref:Cytochrome P450 n=1 Tax=Stachybotrys elegans TaxID=80388 RepID=A0A8K0T2G7_9HYPO|nr:cytochrome P450 [Stachybotrys elegans]